MLKYIKKKKDTDILCIMGGFLLEVGKVGYKEKCNFHDFL